MAALLTLWAGWMLARAEVAMAAASAACALFVRSVMPGLFPYLVVVQLLLSRVKLRHGWQLMLLGWAGGSPTGARLLSAAPGDRRRLAVRCATMSPMFLLGTLGQWLGNPMAAGWIFLSVLLGGYLAGFLAPSEAPRAAAGTDAVPLRFGDAVESGARTMLAVCGTMVMMRVLAALVGEALGPWPRLQLIVMALLEVTTGAQAVAQLPLPLALRGALLAGLTGFGGAAIMLQNRAFYPRDLLSLPRQFLCQSAHALLSFLIALGGLYLGAG